MGYCNPFADGTRRPEVVRAFPQGLVHRDGPELMGKISHARITVAGAEMDYRIGEEYGKLELEILPVVRVNIFRQQFKVGPMPV